MSSNITTSSSLRRPSITADSENAAEAGQPPSDVCGPTTGPTPSAAAAASPPSVVGPLTLGSRCFHRRRCPADAPLWLLMMMLP